MQRRYPRKCGTNEDRRHSPSPESPSASVSIRTTAVWRAAVLPAEEARVVWGERAVCFVVVPQSPQAHRNPPQLTEHVRAIRSIVALTTGGEHSGGSLDRDMIVSRASGA
jgi:hypothetical protein